MYFRFDEIIFTMNQRLYIFEIVNIIGRTHSVFSVKFYLLNNNYPDELLIK